MKNAMQKKDKKKGMIITGIVHTAILLLGLIPMASALQKPAEAEYVIPIEFAEFAQSSDEGLMATSEEIIETTKPVVEKELEEVDIVEEETVEEISQVEEVTEEIVSEVAEEVESEVVASETEIEGSEAETTAEAGQNETSESGETAGNDVVGTDEGQNGLDGDGVITRRIIYRSNISEAAYESGKIMVDVCIDRQGKILTVANNAEGTDISDMDMVRDVLDLVTDYRFEVDYSATLRECGTLTFVFDIETDEMWVEEMASYAANE